MPQIVDVSADGDVAEPIAAVLDGAGVDAVVDAHGEWAGDVRRTLGVVRMIALGVVFLLTATAVSVIAFATHAALLARRDIVEVLHLSGATDRFISRLFERRFWILGLRAGAIGALFALGTVALILVLAVSNSERPGLLPRLSLDLVDITILLATPILAALAARIAARRTVMRSLKHTL